jgi:hypothetical protein
MGMPLAVDRLANFATRSCSVVAVRNQQRSFMKGSHKKMRQRIDWLRRNVIRTPLRRAVRRGFAE